MLISNRSQFLQALYKNNRNLESPLFRDNIYFQNSQVISFRYEIFGTVDGNHRTPYIPFQIDLDSRERIQIRDFLTYDEMMAALCGIHIDISNNNDGVLDYYLQSEEVMRQLWDSIDSIEVMSDLSGRYMGVVLMAEGIVFVIYDGEKENPWPLSILVGKEQFRNTGLYQFWY